MTERPVDSNDDVTLGSLFTLKPDHKRWFIWERDFGCVTHTGHCKLEEHDVKVSTKALSDRDKDLI